MEERGRVWIAWIPDEVDGQSRGHYWCSWQRTNAEMETGPDVQGLVDALSWARVRSTDIVVGPHWDHDQHYWSGPGPVPDSEWIAGRLATG